MGTATERHLDWLFSDEESVFKVYVDEVARSERMTHYKAKYQYGKKAGESLYTHILNGIFLLETMRPLLNLQEIETRVLYTAFTVHDINKALNTTQSFNELATPETLAAEIARLDVDGFFPNWRDYLSDVASLVRGHSGHTGVAGERLIAGRRARYGLEPHRINALIYLMQAADIVDLSHTLDERKHKATFLSHLNTYLSESGIPAQYVFFTHHVVEQRGIFTNIIHNAVIAHLQKTYNATPLLFYPEGAAYLVSKGSAPTPSEEDVRQIAVRVADQLDEMISGDFAEFITSTPHGVKVAPKCLELGIPFEKMLRVIWSKVERKNLDPETLEDKARERAARDFEKRKAEAPEGADKVLSALEDAKPLVDADLNRLRLAELIRTYYIFLKSHFDDGDPWQRIYRLLDLSEERWPVYAYFEARYDRAYVLVRDVALSWDEVYQRIKADGTALLEHGIERDQSRVELFADYLARYLIFGAEGRPQVHFGDALAHYVVSQHNQCVYCGGPFPTDKWMTGDVREDITVQVFSNRLRGGPGEPKKYICEVCKLQFLLEKLNYTEVRGEKILYLHLYPYSFMTAPFIEGLKSSLSRMREEDTALRALNMDSTQAVMAMAETIPPPNFWGRTKRGNPQPYGLYVPRFTKTAGNLLIFPLNPGGKNDTERFLFALWNAMVLQRHFGVKVLLSNAPVAPLGKEDFADLYVDNIPLGCQGLLPHNDYAQYRDGSQEPGTLVSLWDNVQHLFALGRLTFEGGDEKLTLVRALADSPLMIFHTTDRLIEKRLSDARWLTKELQRAFEHTEALALSKGGTWMAQLSEELRKLAEIARSNWIKGRTFKRSSLLFPVAEVFEKLKQAGRIADLEVLRAATAQDIFNHLERIADDKYKPGKTKREAVKAFVDGWHDSVLGEVYKGDRRRLIGDEKLIRSAYLFYFSEAGDQTEDDQSED